MDCFTRTRAFYTDRRLQEFPQDTALPTSVKAQVASDDAAANQTSYADCPPDRSNEPPQPKSNRTINVPKLSPVSINPSRLGSLHRTKVLPSQGKATSACNQAAPKPGHHTELANGTNDASPVPRQPQWAILPWRIPPRFKSMVWWNPRAFGAR